jgi:hypothetical protein
MNYKDKFAQLSKINQFAERDRDIEWKALEHVHQLVLPEQYKQLVDALWNARLFGGYWLFGGLHDGMISGTESLSKMFEGFGYDGLPLYPQKNGYVVVTHTGTTSHLLVKTAPSSAVDWAIVDSTDFPPAVLEITMEAWEFIYKLMTNQLDHPVAQSFYEDGMGLELGTIVSFEEIE